MSELEVLYQMLAFENYLRYIDKLEMHLQTLHKSSSSFIDREQNLTERKILISFAFSCEKLTPLKIKFVKGPTSASATRYSFSLCVSSKSEFQNPKTNPTRGVYRTHSFSMSPSFPFLIFWLFYFFNQYSKPNLAIGAATWLPWPPRSTNTVITMVGFSAGANTVNHACGKSSSPPC